jgi:hypothetical protein
MKKTLSLIIAVIFSVIAVMPAISFNVVAESGYSNGATVWTDNVITAKYYDNDDAARTNGMVAKAEIPVNDKYVTAYFGGLEDVMAAGDVCGADRFEMITSEIKVTSNTEWDLGSRSFTVDGKNCNINFDDNKYVEIVGADASIELPSDEDYTGLLLKNFVINGSGNTSGKTLVRIGKTSDTNKRPVAVTFENVDVILREKYTTLKGAIVVQSNSKFTMGSGSSVTRELTDPKGKITSDDSYCGIYTGSAGAEIVINGASIDIPGCVVNLNSDTAKLTVNSGTLVSQYASAVYASKGTVTVNGGTLGVMNTDRAVGGVVTAVTDTSVTVNGGSFFDLGGKAKWIFNNADAENEKFVLNAATTWGNNNVFSGNGMGVIQTAAMLDGASIRTAADKMSGIRFQSTIDKTVVDNIKNIDNNAVIGTLIAPYEFINAANGVFTKEALSDAGKTYLDIHAVNGINEKDTNYVINASMVKVKEANYGRDFAAVPYISYQTSNGNTVTSYGTFDSEKNVRNIKEVAYCALSDVMVDGEVITETVDGEEKQITVNEAYASSKGYVNVVSEWYEYDRESGVATLVQGKAYTEYYPIQISVIKEYIKPI